MKRQSYLGPTRRLPKAPLPFNLPSLRREAGGDGAGGGIAGAGAKWASPRAEVVEETREEEKHDERSAGSKTAWGGAGLRVRTQPDFPELSRPSISPLGSAPKSIKRVEDAKAVKEAEDKPETLVTKPSTSSSTTSAKPVVEEDDWAEDDNGMDFTADVSLPEVNIPDVPPPPPRTTPSLPHSPGPVAPRFIPGHGFQRRGMVPPPAPHWAHAIKLQQMDRLGDPRGRPSPRMRAAEVPTESTAGAIDLKLLEEQKTIMKTKAELAQEARRKEEAERERIQKERAARKLRELEERLRLKEERRRADEHAAYRKPGPHSADPAGSRRPSVHMAPPSDFSEKADGRNIGSKAPTASVAADHESSRRVVLQRPREEAEQVATKGSSGFDSSEHGPDSSRVVLSTEQKDGQALPKASVIKDSPPTSSSQESTANKAHVQASVPTCDVSTQHSSRRDNRSTGAPRGTVEALSSNALPVSSPAGRTRSSARPFDTTSNGYERRRSSPSRRERSHRYSSQESRGHEYVPYGRRRRAYAERSDYDGPTENETREEWLDRRRKKTETRDAVRFVIEHIIHRAVFGDRRRGRRVYSRKPGLSSSQGSRARRELSKRDSAGDTGNSTSSLSAEASKDRKEETTTTRPTSVSFNSSTIVQNTAVEGTNVDHHEDGKALDVATPTAPSISKPLESLPFQGETPRHAPQRRMAPAPLRPAPWAPKASDARRQQNLISPVTAQIRAEAAQQAAKAMKTGSRSVQQSGDPQSLHVLSSSSPNAVEMLGTTSHALCSNQSEHTLRESDMAQRSTKRSSPRESSNTRLDQSFTHSNVNRSATSNCYKDDSVTIPPTLGGNVKVLMKPNTRRDPGKEGQGYVLSQNGNIARSVHHSSQNIRPEVGQNRAAARRGRGGKSEFSRRSRREFSSRADELNHVENESGLADVNGKLIRGSAEERTRKPFEDDGEESRAWAKGSRTSPPTSFDEITRAFLNQPAAFPLVGAPLLPSVPVVPVLSACPPAGSSSSYGNVSNAWSENKQWPTSDRHAENVPDQWWKTPSRAVRRGVTAENRDPTYREIVPPSDRVDDYDREGKAQVTDNMGTRNASSSQSRMEKHANSLKPRSRKSHRNSRKSRRLVGERVQQNSGEGMPSGDAAADKDTSKTVATVATDVEGFDKISSTPHAGNHSSSGDTHLLVQPSGSNSPLKVMTTAQLESSIPKHYGKDQNAQGIEEGETIQDVVDEKIQTKSSTRPGGKKQHESPVVSRKPRRSGPRGRRHHHGGASRRETSRNEEEDRKSLNTGIRSDSKVTYGRTNGNPDDLRSEDLLKSTTQTSEPRGTDINDDVNVSSNSGLAENRKDDDHHVGKTNEVRPTESGTAYRKQPRNSKANLHERKSSGQMATAKESNMLDRSNTTNLNENVALKGSQATPNSRLPSSSNKEPTGNESNSNHVNNEPEKSTFRTSLGHRGRGGRRGRGGYRRRGRGRGRGRGTFRGRGWENSYSQSSDADGQSNRQFHTATSGGVKPT